MPSWISNYRPDLIAQRIEKTKSISIEGKVSFSGFAHAQHLVLLNSMVELDREVPEIEKRRIISQATFKAGKRGEITSKSILREIGKLEREYLSTERQKYRLITQISVSRLCQFPKVSFDGSSITVHARLNKTTQISRAKLIDAAKHWISGDLPNDYPAVSVSVIARSTAEAAAKALDRLDFVRGIWNYWKNCRHDFRMSTGRRSPVNSILLGPIHTLHKPDGKLATESWWYEPQYQGPVKLYSKKSEIENLFQFLRKFRRHLGKSNYRSDIVQAVVRYVRALDSRDWDVSFLRLWNVLEILTGTLQGSYKANIKRASNLFSEKEFAFQVLSHLKDYRNKSVHTGLESGDIESIMYQIKKYVEILIEFHVAHKPCFSSIQDAAEFMSLLTDKDSIDKKSRKLRCAKKYMSGA